MNKTYRLSYFLNVIDGEHRFYRLNRSVSHRNTKKILGETLAKMPINFFQKNCDGSRRNTFHYKEDYLDNTILLS